MAKMEKEYSKEKGEVGSACSTHWPITVTFKMQLEQQMKPLTGGQALLEKGKDLAKGRTRKLEQSTKLQLFILYLFFELQLFFHILSIVYLSFQFLFFSQALHWKKLLLL